MFYEGERIIKIVNTRNAIKYGDWYKDLIGKEFVALKLDMRCAEYTVKYNDEFCILPMEDVEIVSDTSIAIKTNRQVLRSSNVQGNSKQKAHKPKARANGEGTIFQRSSDKLWIGRLPVGYHPDGNIKYRQFTGKKQSDVREKMDQIKTDIRTNTYVEPNKVIISELSTDFLKAIKPSIKNTTWLSYEAMIRKHINPEVGGIKAMKLSTDDLQNLYNKKLNEGRADGKPGGLSPKTIRYIHQIIYNMLEYARTKKPPIVSDNVSNSKALKLPKNPKKEMKTLDMKEIEKFLDRAKLSRYYAAYFLELYTGLRRGELLGIRWKDIDFHNGKIQVIQQLVKEGSIHVIRELKTESSQNRVISIPKEVVNVLKEHKYKQEVELKALGRNDIEIAEHFKTGLVFITEEGKFVQPRCFDRYFKSILKTAKVKTIRLHDMRHTFALISLQAGADIKTIQNDLGHESIETTLDKYGHVNEKMKKDAANKRSQLLKAITSKNQ